MYVQPVLFDKVLRNEQGLEGSNVISITCLLHHGGKTVFPPCLYIRTTILILTILALRHQLPPIYCPLSLGSTIRQYIICNNTLKVQLSLVVLVALIAACPSLYFLFKFYYFFFYYYFIYFFFIIIFRIF